ncbi:MAG: hypothetical protein C3F02_01345 [Parcubacteria group bacterium]|nr:MAG: hypothetical protein C3F02_01345 [Parcubacteria group bacterium]
MPTLDKVYDQISREFAASRVLAWPELSVVIPYIQDGFKILDLGCGSGRLLHTLESSGKKFDYTGVDFSEGLVSQARVQFPQRNFIVDDITHVDLPAESYDLICMVASFHHLKTKEEREKLLRDVFRWLRHDGYFFMTNWNLWQAKYLKYYLKNFWQKKSWRDFYIPWKSGSGSEDKLWRFYHSFGVGELKKLLGQTGFVCGRHGVYKTKWNIVSLVKE